MRKAPLPENEQARQAALQSYHILEGRYSFDDLVALAAHICEVPGAMVTTVDATAQRVKAKSGLSLGETLRDHSFCAHAIVNPDDILVVTDALADERFVDNPLVHSAPNIRFYAGAPLVTREGFALGTLCVIDQVPRTLSAEQLDALRALRRDIVTELDLRRNLRLLGEAVSGDKRERDDLLAVQQDLEAQALKRMAELREAYEDLSDLNRIIKACSATLELSVILEDVLDLSMRVTDMEGGTVCLIAPDQTLELAAHRNTSEQIIADLTTHKVRVGECLCGNCAKDLTPLVLNTREEVLQYASREAQRREELNFHAAFPLVTGKRCVGVLCVFARSDRKPTIRSLHLIETITAQMAMAIENSRLFRETVSHAGELEHKVRERTLELERKNEELERINRLFVGRELRMRELKKQIRELERQVSGAFQPEKEVPSLEG